ncbi:Endopolyphosphatase [Nakaseomyces bracarensis]|uniref:Endopolyphosphatase n=1 Tax=Nakaseomyces bracarensis TaxID=273131 RepID=A0ABR4NR87_9SACH
MTQRFTFVSVVTVVTVTMMLWFLPFNELREDKGYRIRFVTDEETRAGLEKQLNLGLTPRDPILITDLRTGAKRKLHGRFLHITDIHPDPYYAEGSSLEELCHAGKPGKRKDKARKFGVAMGGCDSPMLLMERTLSWIEDNLKDQVDFVVWTGDNIRHDNDRRYPRTEQQIFDMNAEVAERMKNIFRDHDSMDPRAFNVPVVPSIGNNDVFPHNLFSLGPTLQTREYYRIWNDFIPEEQQRMFDRDASFFTEVIPGKLAVLSLNTLYLFKANPLVDNCDSRKQPGYPLLLWLGYVLDEIRERGMKVWITGHVPPIAKNYDSSCYNKFSLWMHEYRDVIIGGLYGHMNVDHFIPVDIHAVRESMDEEMLLINQEDRVSNKIMEHAIAAKEAYLMGARPVNKEAYMDGVRENYYDEVRSQIEQANSGSDIEVEAKRGKKGRKGKKGDKKKNRTFEELCDDYAIVNVAGSVIPTFNPSFRVWEYNVTELSELTTKEIEYKPWDKFFEELEELIDIEVNMDDSDIVDEMTMKKKKKKVDKSIPKKKPDDIPAGPGHNAGLFSPEKFVHYYANLEEINSKYEKLVEEGANEQEAIEKSFRYEVEYTSKDEPYPMDNLLVRSYLKLASDLASTKKVWKSFKERAFISSGYKDDDDEDD